MMQFSLFVKSVKYCIINIKLFLKNQLGHPYYEAIWKTLVSKLCTFHHNHFPLHRNKKCIDCFIFN